jgi:hypothetical protein
LEKSATPVVVDRGPDFLCPISRKLLTAKDEFAACINSLNTLNEMDHEASAPADVLTQSMTDAALSALAHRRGVAAE